jgi:DNA polymerase-3 subunit epsilon
MREIIFDTETTGIDPEAGHRLVEIGCVEMLNGVVTGQTFHAYLDPCRDVPPEVVAIHGLTTEFLRGKPVFEAIVDDFLTFIADDRLVAHNADFDVRFLNAELKRCKCPALAPARVLDTLVLARRKHPGASNSLDALCQRYGIDNSRRTRHGALLDSEILAEVYIELCGGRQTALGLSATGEKQAAIRAAAKALPLRQRDNALPPTIEAGEEEAHRAFVDSLGVKALWRQYAKASDGVP